MEKATSTIVFLSVLNAAHQQRGGFRGEQSIGAKAGRQDDRVATAQAALALLPGQGCLALDERQDLKAGGAGAGLAGPMELPALHDKVGAADQPCATLAK